MFTPGTGKMSVSVTAVMTSFAISVNAALTISFSTLMFTPHMTAFAIRASSVATSHVTAFSVRTSAVTPSHVMSFAIRTVRSITIFPEAGASVSIRASAVMSHVVSFAIRASPVISPVPVISFFFMFFPVLLFFKVMFLLFSFFEMMVFILSAEMMSAFRSFAGFPVFPFEMRMIGFIFC